MLQTAKFLLKSLQEAMEGKPLAEVVSYLSGVTQLNPTSHGIPPPKVIEKNKQKKQQLIGTNTFRTLTCNIYRVLKTLLTSITCYRYISMLPWLR